MSDSDKGIMPLAEVMHEVHRLGHIGAVSENWPGKVILDTSQYIKGLTAKYQIMLCQVSLERKVIQYADGPLLACSEGQLLLA